MKKLQMLKLLKFEYFPLFLNCYKYINFFSRKLEYNFKIIVTTQPCVNAQLFYFSTILSLQLSRIQGNRNAFFN